MIEEITITQVGSYDGAPQKLSQLAEFNYFYGANGAGKTTISKIICEEKLYPSCYIKWKNGINLISYVYNKDFVEKNFSQDKIKGIFTLGSNAKEIEDSLKNLNEQREKEQTDLVKKRNILEGVGEELGTLNKLSNLEEKFKSSCWKQKTKHDKNFLKAFEGARNSAERFKQRVIDEYLNNKEEVLLLEELVEKSSRIFSDDFKTHNLISIYDFNFLKKISENSIWHERILGKENVSVADLIKLLNNSDWVNEGLGFYRNSAPKCPFCQQETKGELLDALSSYFDDEFSIKKGVVEKLSKEYQDYYEEFLLFVKKINEDKNKFLDIDIFNDKASLLISVLKDNLSKAESKIGNLSEVVNFVDIEPYCKDVLDIIGSANRNIEENNNLFRNKKSESDLLIRQIWAYIVNVELMEELRNFDEERGRLKKQKEGLEKGILKNLEKIEELKVNIEKEEAKQTSVQPTIAAINKLLKSFGFRNFKLSASPDGNHYLIIRDGGADASKTLSEGERTFITFLYFYNLIKGSDSCSGIHDERVVVFDDPISSLDSDILFIVSSLMKNIMDDVKEKRSCIKQIFFLTHNVYFHKELTFNTNRSGDTPLKEETFWVVKKRDKTSIVERHDVNPVKTSYDLLWSELRKGDVNSSTIQNTLRRIIENYFKILGGMDVRKLEVCFDGQEKVIFRSLISWINDGSHFSGDDVYMSLDEELTKKYLIVFQKIFEKSEHTAHFKMMMGKGYKPLESEELLEELSDLNSANDDSAENIVMPAIETQAVNDGSVNL